MTRFLVRIYYTNVFGSKGLAVEHNWRVNFSSPRRGTFIIKTPEKNDIAICNDMCVLLHCVKCSFMYAAVPVTTNQCAESIHMLRVP